MKKLLEVVLVLVFVLTSQFATILAKTAIETGVSVAMPRPQQVPDLERFENVKVRSPYPGVYLRGEISASTWCRAEGEFYSLQNVPGLKTWIWTGFGTDFLFKPYTKAGAWQAASFQCSDNLFQVAVWRLEWLYSRGNTGTPGPFNNLN